LSAGIGNLLDRVFYDGRVIDFMHLGIGSLRTGTFNVSDVCITTGVLLLVFYALQRPRSSVHGWIDASPDLHPSVRLTPFDLAKLFG
jgi:signal peptidase II